MKTSFTMALAAILLLSEPALATWKRSPEVETITVNACEATSTAVSSNTVSASEADGVLKELNNGAVQTPIVIMSTVTVVPLPKNTPDGVFYSGLATGTASGYARPTGHNHRNRTRSNTLPSSTAISNGTLINTTSSSIPFFTLQTTASLALPTNSTSLITVTTSSSSIAVPPTTTSLSSVSIPQPSMPITIASTPIPTLTTSQLSTSPSSSSSLAAASSNSAPQTQTESDPTTTTSSMSSTSSTSSSTTIPFLRGVNLGGWLVLESWMDDTVFSGDFASAVDQYTFDSMPGAEAALQDHWSTFFVESDIASLAATGINALRIPIGFWAYDNADTPYISGADAYLDQAIGWARSYGMKVWVDCHGSPGSQNGFDNSGQQGMNEWQQESNLQRSISVLKTMAAKYGAQQYADVVVGLEMTNEPISYGNNLFSTTKLWAAEAYAAVKAEVENKNLVIVMHDAFQTPIAWLGVAETLLSDLIPGAPKTFGIDTHLYGLYTDAEDAMTQAQHITEACGWGDNLRASNAVMPTYVGEWSAATNICVNPDGSTTAGTTCSVDGCQCQSADFDDWNDDMIETVRKYVEAQLDVFESSSSGYFMWAAKGPGGWGFLNGIEKGIVPNPITSREYPSQCGGSSRREVRGSLGRAGEAW